MAPLEADDDYEWYLDNVVVAGDIQRARIGPVRRRQAYWQALANRLTREFEAADGSPLGRAAAAACAQGFVLTRGQLRCCGVPDATVRRLVRRRAWTRVGVGVVALVPGVDVSAEPPVGRAVVPVADRERERRDHTLRAVAATVKRRNHVMAGASAVIARGLPVRELPALPELVTAAGRTFGRLEGALVRAAHLVAADVEDWYGVPVQSGARAVVDLARFDADSGLMAADAGLAERVLTAEQLAAALSRAGGLTGIRRARDIVSLASGAAESPLESVVRLRLHDAGLPPPQLQFPVTGADGKRYRVDFAWPERRLILEADGRDKYTGDALWAEKRRELAVQQAGWRVLRVRWRDVYQDWPQTHGWLAAALSHRSG